MTSLLAAGRVFSGPWSWPEGGRAGSPCSQLLSPASPSWQREVDRNQELLTRIRQLQEREAEAEAKMKEQLEHNRLCKQGLDMANKKLREKEDSLAQAGEVRGRLQDAIAPRCCPFLTLLPACAPTFLGTDVIVAEIVIFYSMVFS